MSFSDSTGKNDSEKTAKITQKIDVSYNRKYQKIALLQDLLRQQGRNLEDLPNPQKPCT